MKRLIAVLLLAAAGASQGPAYPPPPAREFVQAVEFPYYAYPRDLWERELVWLKNIGVNSVAFTIPWNWHQLEAGDFDFTGRTSPRRDLVAFIRILRRLGLHGWVRPLAPVPGWVNRGSPESAGAAAQRAWLRELETILATQTVKHGGPIAWVEGRALAIDAAAPPAPVTQISAADPLALARSRAVLSSGFSGAILWTDVEDTLLPAGFAADPATLLHKGAVGLSGDERPAAIPLRRDAALLRNWGPQLGALRPAGVPKAAAGKYPAGVTAAALVSSDASAVSVTNSGSSPFHDEIRLLDPVSGRSTAIPGITVPPGESLWLPVNVSLGPSGLCKECTNFSEVENVVYATAELLSIEFENGILAMEFAAPESGEAVLQLARKPVGPYLAAGVPRQFDWDDKALRARLVIPANPADGHRVRVGIAIEEPETSAFFKETRRLIVGQKNVVTTTYSSDSVAKRSRLRLPEGYTAIPTVRPPDEIDYEIAVPPDAMHGDYANLAIEADGMLLGRARLQLFRPVSIRLMEAMQIHFGNETELTPEPPTTPVDPQGGSNVELSIRNNWPAITTYRLEASGEGLDFFPVKTEVAVGATEERHVPLRIFAKEGVEGLRTWNLKVSGGAALDLPMRVVLIPRARTVAWSADLDGDGSPEWVLETQKVRAVFSRQDGGRWMEFNWKDTNLNYLPERGVFAASGPVEVRAAGDALEFTGKGWKRTVRLSGTTVSFEQTVPLAADGLTPERRGNIDFKIDHPSPTRAVYALEAR